MADDSVKIDIELVTKAFDSALKASTKNAQDFGTDVSKSFNKASNAFDVFKGSLAANIVADAFRSMKSALGGFVTAAADIEQATTKLETLTGSADTAQKLMKELTTFAAKTPFELKGITQAATQLLAFSFKAKEIPSLLQTLGDISASVGKPLTDLSVIFGQVAGAGKLTGERLNQLNEAAVPIGPALAKTMGVAESSIRQLVTEGKVSFDIFKKAMISVASEGGPAFQGMIKQSTTLNGILSTLGDSISLFGAGLVQEMLPAIKSVASSFITFFDFLAANKNTLVSILQYATPIIVAFGIAASGALLGVAASFAPLAAAATAAWAAVTGPIGLITIGLATIATAAYAVYKNFDILKAGAYDALAATLEFAAKGAALFSEEKAATLLAQAEAYRTQAGAIREATSAVVELDSTAANASAAEAERLAQAEKTRAEQVAKEQEFQKAIKDIKLQYLIATEQEKLVLEAEELARTDAKFAKLVADVGMEQAIKLQAEKNVTTGKVEEEKIRLKIETESSNARVKKHFDEIEAKKKLKQEDLKDTESYWRTLMGMTQQGETHAQVWANKTAKEKADSTKWGLGQVAMLTSQSNRELFAIGKAAAIANATIDGIAAVQKALTSAPPPFNYALAAAVGVVQAANVSKIASQQPPAFANGGIVPGTSFSGDNVIAKVNSGEMVLNKAQQAQLFKQANGQGGVAGGVEELLTRLIDVVQNQSTSININGREIINVVKDGLASGRSLA